MRVTSYSIILLLCLLGEKQLFAIKIPQVWVDLIKTALNNHESLGHCAYHFFEAHSLMSQLQDSNHCPHPEYYLCPSLLIWDPLNDPKLGNQIVTLTCPLCNTALREHNTCWSDGTHSYQPRVLHSFKCQVLLISKIYHCHSNHVLLSHDERIIHLLPNSLHIPFILLHKTGYTMEFVDSILSLCKNGVNFYKIESMVVEAHWNHHCISEHRFWQDMCDYKTSHPTTSIDDSIKFPSFSISNGLFPSNDAIAQCFLKDFLKKEGYYLSEMISLSSDSWISLDHTFKVAANIGYVRDDKKWIQQYNAAFFVLDNLGRVLTWQFTNGTSFDDIELLLNNLHHRFKNQGCMIKQVFIDNCCHWRKKIKSIFGNETDVYLDLFHAVQRVSRVLSRKHPLYMTCISDLRRVFRSPGDIGIDRCKPTPSSEIMIKNLEAFVKKWSDLYYEEKPVLTNAANEEIEKLKVHINKGCLSNIGVGCGTNRNEALHRHINSFFHQSKMSILLAYALMTVLLHSHNSCVQIRPKRVVKPITACIAESQKTFYQNLPNKRMENTKEAIGITSKRYQNAEVVYDKFTDYDEENSILDINTAESILLNAIQQSIVLSNMKNCPHLEMYSTMQNQVETLFDKPKTSSLAVDDNYLGNLVEANGLKIVPTTGDGNCCFTSVAISLRDVVQKDQSKDNKLLGFLNSIGLQINDLNLEEISLRLRELTIEEWLGENRPYYENFLTTEVNIDDAAKRFSDPKYFQNDLGDTMILVMSNVLGLPIIVFSTIPEQPLIPVLPKKAKFDSLLLFVAYHHLGPGHYDGVIMDSQMKLNMKTDISCRCGVNGTKPSCCDNDDYKTRCKCYNRNKGCSKHCKCKNCDNPFGKRSILGKRVRIIHDQQYSLPNSKEFAVSREEKLKQGPWTVLENALFIHIMDHLCKMSENMTTKNVLQAYNEVIFLIKSSFNCIQIPANIMTPNYKTSTQMQGKLQHYHKQTLLTDIDK